MLAKNNGNKFLQYTNLLKDFIIFVTKKPKLTQLFCIGLKD